MKHKLDIVNGRVVRPGFGRKTTTASKAYTKQAGSGSLDRTCVFCPEGASRREAPLAELRPRLPWRRVALYVIHAKPAYAHFDAQRVVEHRLIVPYQHVESKRALPAYARRMIQCFIRQAEREAPRGTVIQSYTRSPDNPSKSVGHLHTHVFTLSLDPLTEMTYDIEHGVTELEFAALTDAQIDEIESSRRPQ